MSELYGTTYRDHARPEAISATKLLGQVMLLVGIALGFAALGSWIGRDIAIGTARLLSIAGTAATLATGIFVSIVNIFVSLLNIFSR